jgi:hypothetical protein
MRRTGGRQITLTILQHMRRLSHEDLCARWVENPHYQLFCGEEFFQHKLTFDRSSLTRWRQRTGEQRLVALIQEGLAVATRTGAAERRLLQGDCGPTAAEGGGLSDRRQAHASSARAADEAG